MQLGVVVICLFLVRNNRVMGLISTIRTSCHSISKRICLR